MKVTIFLSLICIIIFFICLFSPEYLIEIIYLYGGFSLNNLLSGYVWTLFTSIFLHASFNHLIFNMFGLILFGSILEKNLGSSKFLFLFILFGIIVNLCSVFFYSPSTICLGASGAIFGLIGVAMIIKPFDILWIFPLMMPVPIILIGIIYIISEFALIGADDMIAHTAHLLGIALGILFGLIYRRRYDAG